MQIEDLTAAIFGVMVGFSLGLTGVGTVFAVPLLVYGIGLGAHRAVCIAMVAVGALSGVSALGKYRARELDVSLGLIVGASGMIGAPFGAWINRRIPERLLLLLFAMVVGTIGLRMLWQATKRPHEPGIILKHQAGTDRHQPMSFRYAGTDAMIRFLPALLAGFVAGTLAGLIGVGGGFVIVPALVLFVGLEIHRAVAASLLSGTLIGISAVTAHLLAGQRVPFGMTALFALGGVLGLYIGSLVCSRISGLWLQRLFAVVILCMATFMVIRNLH